ncbi:MAG: hypothetical protein GOVbin2833_33 [Prokaryotic dsDNA virus sp.]|nr:MAG: hypothetical protein GOVbin2833_33 [Prokaryotic dsDNA virus sp.]
MTISSKNCESEWERIYDYDDWDRCELCEEWWCPRCDIHAWECPCMTMQMAEDNGYEISDCGKYARIIENE